MVETIRTTIPSHLLQQARAFVSDGWISDMDALVAESLRRFIESHQAQLVEKSIREDIEWRLHGND